MNRKTNMIDWIEQGRAERVSRDSWLKKAQALVELPIATVQQARHAAAVYADGASPTGSKLMRRLAKWTGQNTEGAMFQSARVIARDSRKTAEREMQLGWDAAQQDYGADAARMFRRQASRVRSLDRQKLVDTLESGANSEAHIARATLELDRAQRLDQHMTAITALHRRKRELKEILGVRKPEREAAPGGLLMPQRQPVASTRETKPERRKVAAGAEREM